MSGFQFNAAQVAPAVALEPIPAGWYLVKMVESEIKPTNDQTGAYLLATFQVLAGPYAGRKLFARHNVRNANAQAVDIGMRQISAICHATGVMQINDTTQLHDRPLEAMVKLKPAEGNYSASNDVDGYRAVGSGKTPADNGAGAGGAASAPAMAAPGNPAPAFAPPPAGGFAPAPMPGQPAPNFAPPTAVPPNAAPPAAAPPAFAPPAFAPPAAAPAPAAPPPAPAAAFPPAGWTKHPNSPEHYYKGQEVLTEAQLRAQMVAAAPAPAFPSAPAVPPTAQAPAAAGNVPSWAQR